MKNIFLYEKSIETRRYVGCIFIVSWLGCPKGIVGCLQEGPLLGDTLLGGTLLEDALLGGYPPPRGYHPPGGYPPGGYPPGGYAPGGTPGGYPPRGYLLEDTLLEDTLLEGTFQEDALQEDASRPQTYEHQSKKVCWMHFYGIVAKLPKGCMFSVSLDATRMPSS